MIASERLFLLLIAALLTGPISGCTGAMSDVTIPISMDSPPAINQQHAASFRIEVADLRRAAAMRRTSFSVSLGEIILSPPENELIKELVSNALLHILSEGDRWQDMPTVYCGIKTFDIVTPATAFYWDVTAQIELILRIQGRERAVSSEVSERTWVYPSAKLIQRVTTQALRDISVTTVQELHSLINELD